MICKFCGNVIEDNSDFCFICGQKVVTEAPAYAAEVYSQKPEGAPAEAAPVAPEQPVYAVPAQPVYTAPVVPAPAEEETGKKAKKKAKKAKKAKKEKNTTPAISKGSKFFTGLFSALFFIVAAVMLFMSKALIAVACGAVAVLVAVIFYTKYKKAMAAGYEAKAAEIINASMIGLCVGMFVLVLSLAKTYLLG